MPLAFAARVTSLQLLQSKGLSCSGRCCSAREGGTKPQRIAG